MKTLNKFLPGIITVGLLCLLVFAGLNYSAGQAPVAAQRHTRSMFDFDRFTKNEPFKLNTLPTTQYGPPWADIMLQPSNMLDCSARSDRALLLFRTWANHPCTLDGLGIANCTCYERPAGDFKLTSTQS
jgi:hypothetical protein